MIESGGELVVYRSSDGGTHVQLRAVHGTAWLAQTQVAELYGTSVPNIVQIARRILEDGELTEATINSELRVQAEGSRNVRREVKVYSLDMILAIGYRVSTSRAVQFRQWATTVLREYLVKGFVLDDQRLKDSGGTDYFDELLARIRDIRASERRFYQKVCDVFAETSADYDGTSETARTFFATIQNKLIFAVTGSTAGELVTQTDRFLDFNEREVLRGSGSVSATEARTEIADRYVEFDDRRRAAEAERAAVDELDDLRALTEIERPPGGPGSGSTGRDGS